jgi:drug/metabolite transporter (DMT)-like permease
MESGTLCNSSAIFGSLNFMAEKRKIWHWLALLILSLIWGTSYILMKKGLESFSPLQVGALRIVITFICLLPIALKHIRHFNRTNILSIIIIGLFGSLIPAFLFPLAETRISSSLAGMLNSLSPVFTLLFGITIYKRKTFRSQIAGVFLGLLGATGLLYTGSFTFNIFGLFVVLATILSGISSNEVSRVKSLNGIRITALSFFVTSPLAIIYLACSDLSAPMHTVNWVRNLCFIGILAVLGSATAVVIFYVLIRDTSPVFASSVTYFIPIVASLWGLADNEHFSSSMIISVVFIFAGVFIINRPDFFKKRRPISDE